MLTILTFITENLNDEQKRQIETINIERLARSQTALVSAVSSLENGLMTFSDFEFFSAHEAPTLSLCQVSDELSGKIRKIQVAFTARKQEREAFMAFHSSLSDLWVFCKGAVTQGALQVQMLFDTDKHHSW